ncbi:hypothetical protein HMN09_00183600 [Mycena chlorophos]|uniref:Uncharacterized protein n=1 Tax=Mycena chlorophos TaxID=658473 RepID=A0A8H6TLB6_MYCCL|nr:hypothetical protein HMN09_00183600 [Mycena chlorophos]
MASNVPSIRLIVPTPDVSAISDPNSSIASRAPTKKKSVMGMFGGSVSSAQTPYNTARGAGDLSDIVRRVAGGGDGSVSGRGWEVHVDSGDYENDATVRRQSAEGEGMVLIKKKVKTRGRIDGIFADATNTRSESPQPAEGGAKDKWWTLSRGRKDTGPKDGGVLGLIRRGKSPGPGSLPPTPTLDPNPDCTLDMVEVPSLRGRAVVQNLPPQHFPAQKRYNSLGASSALAPAHPQPRTEFHRSVSAGSAALLAQSQSQQQHPLPQYAHMTGAATPYATMTRAETYQPPEASKSKPKPPQRSASALGVYSSNAPPEFKRSLTALVGGGIVLGAPASTLGQAPTPVPLSRAPTPVSGQPRSGTPTPGFLNVPGKDKDNQGSIALRAMRSVKSMARLWDEKDEEQTGTGTGTGTLKGKKSKKEDAGKEEKEKKKREKEEKKKDKKVKEGKRVPKSSGSSFEIGALGASPVQRKRSILGLGLGMSGTLGKSSTTSNTGIGIGMGLHERVGVYRVGARTTLGKRRPAEAQSAPEQERQSRTTSMELIRDAGARIGDQSGQREGYINA